jgi:hypothetical protein
MARYADGFVIPLPKNCRLPPWRSWEPGSARPRRAEYYECTGEDSKVKGECRSRLPTQTQRDCCVSGSYKSRAHRDRVNANNEGS